MHALVRWPPVHERAVWIAKHAAEYLAQHDDGCDEPNPDEPIERLIELVVEHWPEVAIGAHDRDVMQHAPRLWAQTNLSAPMGLFGTALARHVEALVPNRDVLEIGAGVGNTTRWLPHAEARSYLATDLHPEITRDQHLGVRTERLDLDDVHGVDLDLDGYLDLIVGTNVLHCVSDPVETLRNLESLLYPGGMVAIAEGVPMTLRGIWPLTWVYGIFDGWWNRGGFRSLTDWTGDFLAAGYDAPDWSPILAEDLIIGYIVKGRTS